MNSFTCPFRVYYEDTDAGGVVYHANYLCYMERARTEWLRDMGWPVDEIIRQYQSMFIVRSLEMKFIRPARLGDKVFVSAKMLRHKKASMRLAQEVCRRTKNVNETLVTAEVELAMVSCESFRPVAMPEFLRAQDN